MFTGIVEETGIVQQPAPRLVIQCADVLADLAPGASIAVNGVCLTAVEIGKNSFLADISPETMERSNLGSLAIGDPVNLERPLTLSARLSGHLVQGHVDATGELLSLDRLRDGNWWLRVAAPAELERYLVFKGSIAIDGISLTIAALENSEVAIAIIPHTYERTNLRTRMPGDRVNIECDMIAKHVEKLTVSALRQSRLPPDAPDRGRRVPD